MVSCLFSLNASLEYWITGPMTLCDIMKGLILYMKVLQMMMFFTRWWFQVFCYVQPYLGKISKLTSIFFQKGWFNHQLV